MDVFETPGDVAFDNKDKGMMGTLVKGTSKCWLYALMFCRTEFLRSFKRTIQDIIVARIR